MQCPYCRTDNPRSAVKCAACGKTLRSADPSTTNGGRASFVYVPRSDRAYLPLLQGMGVSKNIIRRKRFLTGSSSAQPGLSGGTGFKATATQTETNPWQRDDGLHTETDVSPQEYGRIEPTLDASRLPPDPNYFAKLDDDAAAHRRTPASRLRWLGLMAGVFAIGAGVGLGGAWWLHSSAGDAGEPESVQSSAPLLQEQSSSGRTSMRGISPNELPYDGAAPPADKEAAVTKPPAIAKDGPSIIQSSGASLPEPEQGAAASQSTQPMQPTQPTQPTQSITSERKAQEADAGSESPARVVRKSSSGSVAGAAPRRKNVARLGDREIQRIRRQADEELKKKTERRQGIAGDVTKSKDSEGRRTIATTVTRRGASITSALVAQCAKAPNFIQREICKWRVCNGKWGTHGCPSYQTQAANY